MKEKKTKIYRIQDKQYTFNYEKFAVMCADRSRIYKLKKTSTSFLLQLEEDLNGEATTSTIKGWIYGNNSPATLDMIEKIADTFNVDTEQLLIEQESIKAIEAKEINKNMVNNTVVTDGVRERVDLIYCKFYDVLKKYELSEGFSEGSWLAGVFEDDPDIWVEGTVENSLAEYIKKSRAYLDADTITRLQALISRIFDTYSDEEKSLYLGRVPSAPKVPFYNTEDNSPTGYGCFLQEKGQEDSYKMQAEYLQRKLNSFYEELEDCLSKYLP